MTEAQALAMQEGTVAVFAAGKRAILVDSRTVLVRRIGKLPLAPETLALTDKVTAPLPPGRARVTEMPRLPAPASTWEAKPVVPPTRQRRRKNDTTAPAARPW